VGVIIVSAIYLKRSRRHQRQRDNNNNNNTKKIEMKDLECQDSEPTKSNDDLSIPRTISKGLPTLASENTVQLGAFFKSCSIVKPAPETPKNVDKFESAESGLTSTRSFDSSMLDLDVHDNELIL